MVCFTPMLKVSQSEAWSNPFSITGFFKEVSLWVAFEPRRVPVVFGHQNGGKVGGPGGLCSWGSQPPSGGQYGSGTRGHAFGRPEHGDAPRVQKGWKGITKKNWKSVKQSQHLQSPLVCFVAVCSSFTKKACRDSLLLRRALKYKSEFVMCGYDSKWLEQKIPQIIALLLLTLYKYGPLSNFGVQWFWVISIYFVDVQITLPRAACRRHLSLPPLEVLLMTTRCGAHKKRLAGCGHLKFSEWTWYLFGACSLVWRLQLNFKIAKSTNHGCNGRVVKDCTFFP